MRKSVWKLKAEKHASRALFLANYLLKNKPEDPGIEKLVKTIRDEKPTEEKEEGAS